MDNLVFHAIPLLVESGRPTPTPTRSLKKQYPARLASSQMGAFPQDELQKQPALVAQRPLSNPLCHAQLLSFL